MQHDADVGPTIGYDINWHDSWKKALEKLAETGELKNDILNSPRAKDGRGNISPVTIIFPTLAMKSKLKVGKKISADECLSEMIKAYKEENNADPSEKDIEEMKKFLKNR